MYDAASEQQKVRSWAVKFHATEEYTQANPGECRVECACGVPKVDKFLVSHSQALLLIAAAVAVAVTARALTDIAPTIATTNPKCGHAAYAGTKSGFDLSNLVRKEDTTAHWREQYENLPVFEVPSTAAINDLLPKKDMKLLAPMAMPPQRGGKKRKRMDNAHFHSKTAAQEKNTKEAKASKRKTAASGKTASGAKGATKKKAKR